MFSGGGEKESSEKKTKSRLIGPLNPALKALPLAHRADLGDKSDRGQYERGQGLWQEAMLAKASGPTRKAAESGCCPLGTLCPLTGALLGAALLLQLLQGLFRTALQYLGTDHLGALCQLVNEGHCFLLEWDPEWVWVDKA